METAAYVYLLAGIALLFVVARYARDLRRRRTLGRFASVLDPENRLWLERLALNAAAHHEVVRGSTDEAHKLWPEDAQAARARLRLACDQIERVSLPTLHETLRVLRELARTVKVFPPPRPLAVAAYEILRTRGWAALLALVQWLGLTGQERVRVRLWFVRRAFATAARVYLGTAVLVVEHGFGRPWYPTLDAAVSDMKTAHDETLVTARHVLDAVARWREYRAQRRA
jgi:hypothetical protein